MACSGLETGHEAQRLDLGGMPGPGAGTEQTRPTEAGEGRKALVYPCSLVRVVALAHSSSPRLCLSETHEWQHSPVAPRTALVLKEQPPPF